MSRDRKSSDPLDPDGLPVDGKGRDRKAEHIELARQSRMQVEHNAFDDWALGHAALPEVDFDEVDTSCLFLGKRLTAPLLISCMTGGTEQATSINRNLAQAAQARGIALGVGSQRKALEDPATAKSFEVRRFAPDVALIGNLGAVQLNYGYGVEECRAAVEMVAADALALHLNPLQEAIQPEGNRRFSALLPKIAMVAEQLGKPVIAKEVGSGIDRRTARRLSQAGVRIIDTAGVGGTSWARIEAARAQDLELGELFADWGLSTPESIRQVATLLEIEVIGSGGIRHGVDAAKALALGASMVGMAYPFLAAAMVSTEAVIAKIDRTIHELRVAMFCLGAPNVAAMRQATIRSRPRH